MLFSENVNCRICLFLLNIFHFFYFLYLLDKLIFTIIPYFSIELCPRKVVLHKELGYCRASHITKSESMWWIWILEHIICPTACFFFLKHVGELSVISLKRKSNQIQHCPTHHIIDKYATIKEKGKKRKKNDLKRYKEESPRL